MSTKFNNDTKIDFNDIVLVPEIISLVKSRKDVNPFTREARLPLMVSPMDTVICKDNWAKFIFGGDMLPCMPRGEYVDSQLVFNSISLDEFEEYVMRLYNKMTVPRYYKILVDVANGHMSKLINLCVKFQEVREEDHVLMVGNIANPKTYEEYAKVGVDYVRVGIGGGQSCLTSANTGVHYPMASLIKECFDIKKEKGYKTRIVADGGFRNYDEIIKALALGADYVMLGGILNKCLESCGDTTFLGIKVSPFISQLLWNNSLLKSRLYKSFRGMSSKAVQKKWNRAVIKTAEGLSKKNKVEYTIKQWSENFQDYLRSAMSYTNSTTLEEFKDSQFISITQNALMRFKK